MARKRRLPQVELPTRKNFDVSYNRISTDDWNKLGGEFAVWMAGYKYAINKINKILIEQFKKQENEISTGQSNFQSKMGVQEKKTRKSKNNM
jgi:hypothetical protein